MTDSGGKAEMLMGSILFAGFFLAAAGLVEGDLLTLVLLEGLAGALARGATLVVRLEVGSFFAAGIRSAYVQNYQKIGSL